MSCNLASFEHRSVRFAAALSIALPILVGASAPSRAAEPDLSITVFADHYSLTAHAIDDVDVLEAAVGSLRARTVRLNACGNSAEYAQRAAAHRLGAMSMELRWVAPDEPGCRAATATVAVPIDVGSGRRPYGIDDADVDRWWHERMP